MVDLIDLLDITPIENDVTVEIINKPFDVEHLLWSSDTDGTISTVLLDALDGAEVVEIDLGSVTKIIIDVDTAYFDLGDEDLYGSGLVDFYDIEHNSYDENMANVYRDMGFSMK